MFLCVSKLFLCFFLGLAQGSEASFLERKGSPKADIYSWQAKADMSTERFTEREGSWNDWRFGWKIGKIIYASVGHLLAIFMKICLNNRFESSGELFWSILANKILVLFCEGPKPIIFMISGFLNHQCSLWDHQYGAGVVIGTLKGDSEIWLKRSLTSR